GDLEVLAQRYAFVPGLEPAQLLELRGPPGGHGVANALEHDLAGDAIELHVTAGGEERKALPDLALELATAAAEQGLQTPIEAELGAMVTHEVEHGAHGLAGAAPQAPPELLQEQGGALGGAQHQQRV